MPTPPSPVLALGDVAVDWIVRVRRLPTPGGNAWSDPPSVTPGGSGANVAVGLAARGVAVRFCGRFGDDAWGPILRADLLERGVALVLPDPVPGVATPVVIAVVDEEGERTLLSCARGSAQTALRARDVPAAAWDGVGWLHATGILAAEEPSRSDLPVLLRAARGRGIPVSFDLNLRLDADSAAPAVLGAVAAAAGQSDIVFASAPEAMVLTGAASPREAALALAVGRRAVVRVGAAGALVAEARAVAALARGASLADAARSGNEAAAVAVRARGAREFAPGVRESDLIAAQPERARP